MEHRKQRVIGFGVTTMLLCAASPDANSQPTCAPSWQPSNLLSPSSLHYTRALRVWTPPNSLHTQLVVAGDDLTFGPDVPANHIAVFDLSSRTWSPLGQGVPFRVSALGTLATGDLVAGGGVGWSLAIMRWDGTEWSPIGDGLPSARVMKIVVTPTGDLIAGGSLTQVSGVTFNNIARWDGVRWSPLGNGFGGGVRSLVALPNGDIVAAGAANSSFGSGTTTAHISRWDGAAWSAFGSDLTLPVVSIYIEAMLVQPDGDLIIGGRFATSTTSDTTHCVYRWDGATWSAVGTGLLGNVRDLARDNAGGIIAVGDVASSEDLNIAYIARWNGVRWSPVGALLPDYLECVTVLPDGDIAVSGLLTCGPSSFSGCFTQIDLSDGCCDSIDFNRNSVFPEDADVIDFFMVLDGGECAQCNDIDFNNNGVFPEDQDVIDFFTVLAGGECGA